MFAATWVIAVVIQPNRSFTILEQTGKYEATLKGGAFLRQTVSVKLPDGVLCDVTGNVMKISGSFELPNQRCVFDGATIFSNDSPVATYNYSSGMMGVGLSFAFSDLNGEYLFALRPQLGVRAKSRFLVSNREESLAEITGTFFGTRFTVSAGQKLRTELVLLCLWVAATKMTS